MEIRKAGVGEVPAIARLVNSRAEVGDVLPRTPDELYENVRDFFVATDGPAVLGCCSLKIMGADLAEVRSLVVAPEAQGSGLGRLLVEACVGEARGLGIPRVFALTAKPVFFEKLGFSRVARSAFPQKVWKDCFSCRFFESCGEVAVERLTEDLEAERPEYLREPDTTRTE